MTEKDQTLHLRDQLEAGERGGSDFDREALLECSDRLRRMRAEYTWHRHLKILRHCTIMSEQAPINVADTRDDPDACRAALDWIHREYDINDTPYTNQDYRCVLRTFGKRTLGRELAAKRGEREDIVPPVMDRIINTTLPNAFKPRPDPAEMLWWDDHVEPMLEECRHSRDAALIAMAWDLGARSSEICELRIGDISDYKYGMKVSLDGKTGQRAPPLITSVPHVNRWLADHPRSNTPTAPLWCKLDSGEEISYRMKLKILKKPARKAGIDHTDITFTRFRKSSASFLASQGLKEAHLEEHHGWSRGSGTAAHYVAVFGDANDRAVAEAHGMEIDETDDADPVAPLECPRCQRETPRERPDCMWCGQALSHESIREHQSETMELLDMIGSEEGDGQSALIKLGKILEEYPALQSAIDSDVDVSDLVDDVHG